MTTLDPYPPELLEIEEQPAIASQLLTVETDERLVTAINRLAQAVEQLALATLDSPAQWTSAPVTAAGGSALAALPPVSPQAVGPVADSFDGCPTHHQPWKVVPAGVSKKTGRSYESFRACPVAGCDQRPRL